MTDMSIQSEAMKRYFALNGIRNRDIAEALGVAPSNVSNMLAGRDSLGRARAQTLHDAFGFNVHFLMTGEGDLLAPDEPKPTVRIEQNGGAHSSQTANVGASEDTVTMRAQLEAQKAQIQALKDENFRLWQMIEKMTSKT
jgi:transcriptional regulator with XRE-family HTH domain